MLWYVFPIKENMSWEGHLSGLVVGFVFALIFKTAIAKPPKYVWEAEDYDESQDLFLQQFDADGNLNNWWTDADRKNTTQRILF